MFAEVVHRAGAQQEIYLETMLTPDQGEAMKLGREIGWNDDFAVMRERLLTGGMAQVVADGHKNLDVRRKQDAGHSEMRIGDA